MLSRILRFLKPAPKLSPHIKLNELNSCAVITLDRPPVNAINHDMYRTCYHYLRQLESSKSHVIIKGANGKFSAGGDVKNVVNSSIEVVKDIFRHQLRIYELISRYQIPITTICDGITMGGASPFSVPAKFSVATDRTIYAMPETALGFFNDAGASYFLSRLQFNVGLYIGMTGVRLQGLDVVKTGLATHFVESSKIENLEKDLIVCKTEKDLKDVLDKFSNTKNESGIDAIMSKIDKCFDGDSVEEIYENLHHEGSDWAMNTIRTLNKMSPTSLKVTHKNIMNGKKSKLEDCLKTEFRLAHNFSTTKCDFNEGVRAVLVDKDNKPKWNPSKLSEVKDEFVESFFKPLPNGEELTFE